MAIMEALLIVCSKFAFNIGPIPLTLQTFAVFIIPLILGVKKSIIVFSLYIIMGIAGLPVFSKGGGFSYVFEPSFGFIIGFFISSIIIGISSNSNKIYSKYLTTTIGLLVINICGVIYMYLIMNYYLGIDKSFIDVISLAVLPFIAKDFITAFLACIIYSRLSIILYHREKTNISNNMNMYDI